jgi:phage tail tape-measure protein
MPEASIVITATDRYSSAVKSMASVTKSFSKDTEQMEKTLTRLQKNKYELKVKTDEARTELKALEKQYAETGDEADRLKVEMAQAKYTTAQQNLSLVTKGAAAAQRQMEKTGEAFRKVDTAAGGAAGMKGIVSAVAAAGAGQMLAQAAQQAGNTLIGSSFGSATGSTLSSAISGAISGAAIGNIIPGIGTAVGAAIGGAAGLVTGATQAFSTKDEAFKSYVQTATENALSERESDLSAGSSIAAGREQKQLAFSTLLGGDDQAKAFLGQVKTMAATTNYTYDEITGYAKSMVKPFGTGKTLEMLMALSDTSAALSLNSSDNSVLIAGLSRMKLTDKTTQEYLNYFSERGIDVYEALSKWGDAAEVADKVTAGKIKGSEAVDAIISYMQEQYGGLSEKMARTYEGLMGNLEDVTANMNEAYGAGYNDTRSKGLADQIDYLSGTSGEQMQVANKAIGAWYASLENQKEQMIRDAQQEVLNSADYWEAIGAGTDEGYAEAGRMLMEAKVKAQSEYNASDGAQLLLESEKTLAETVRDDAASNDAFWDAGYQKGQWFSKGLAASWADGLPSAMNSLSASSAGTVWTSQSGQSYDFSGYAYGLDYVPRDDFPALLHQGERVQTASQARAADKSGGGVVVQFHEPVYIREDADIEKLADAIERRQARRAFLAVP